MLLKAALWNFMLILAVPVDKGGSVRPNVMFTCSLHLTPRCKETTSPGGERAAGPETDFQLAAEATRMHPEQTPTPFRLMSRKNPTWWQALRVTIRN